MPVILQPDDFGTWLSRDIDAPEELHYLYQPRQPEQLAMYIVDQAVNKVANDFPELITPLDRIQ